MEYKLSAQLIGHEDDVRGVCICGGSATIATASRDRRVRVWSLAEDGRNFLLKNTLQGHTSFVGPVAWLPPCQELPAGGLVSGGMDTKVIVWKLDSSEPAMVLEGHELQVTSVGAGREGEIFSASVDSTVRLWSKGAAQVLKGHRAPVQTAIFLPDGVLVTGSSDTTIKFWKGSSCIKSINAHTDTVRGLALMPNVGFVSASHDCSLKLWSSSGEQLLEMVGHTAIVYSVTSNAAGEIASGSEDGHAKIWRGGACVQSIEHPGCVWDLKFLPNGDLVTACSDGIARVWTTDPSRFASPEEVSAFETLITARKLEKKTVGGVKISELPGPEALQQPGARNGENKIVREGDNAVAYCWNAREYNWDKIGEVVDGPDEATSGEKLDGVTYDYVFNVDIGDGQPTRKLPYNRGENPYITADKWLAANDLSEGYKQQVVDFILQNTGQQQQSFMELDNCFYDPYTGGNAYVPQQQNARPAPVYKLKHIPRAEIVLFNTPPQSDGLLKKLTEFNSGVRDEIKLTPDELSKIKEICQGSTSRFSEAELEVLINKLVLWPASNLFPVLDFLRFFILDARFASYLSQREDALVNLVKNAVNSGQAPNTFLSIRLLVNCFRHESFRSWLNSQRSEILDLFSNAGSSTNKNIRNAYVHLLLNFSLRLIATKDESGQLQVLSAALEMAGPEETDMDVRFHALQTIGSLIHSGLVKNVASDLDIRGIVQDAKSSRDSKVSEAGADLDHLFK